MSPLILLGGGFMSNTHDTAINLTGLGFGKLAAMPWGHNHPYQITMPLKAGGIASFRGVAGAGTTTAAINGGKNAAAALTGAGSLSAVGDKLATLFASLAGSGTISNAAAVAYLNLAAQLAGSGDLAGAATAIGRAAAALSGDGDLAGLATALGELEATIVVTGDLLNSANVASAVWGALAAANNTGGTMGEKLNDAGSAANPWTE